jgi:hypothetical protein
MNAKISDKKHYQYGLTLENILKKEDFVSGEIHGVKYKFHRSQVDIKGEPTPRAPIPGSPPALPKK